MRKSDFLCQNRVCRGQISRYRHQKFQNWLKITIFMTFFKISKKMIFSKMYREIRENIQLLKIGPLESRKNWHAALKWVIMTKSKSGVLAANFLEARYCIFLLDGGTRKWFFLTLLSFASFWFHGDKGHSGGMLEGWSAGVDRLSIPFSSFKKYWKIWKIL